MEIIIRVCCYLLVLFQYVLRIFFTVKYVNSRERRATSSPVVESAIEGLTSAHPYPHRRAQLITARPVVTVTVTFVQQIGLINSFVRESAKYGLIHSFVHGLANIFIQGTNNIQ